MGYSIRRQDKTYTIIIGSRVVHGSRYGTSNRFEDLDLKRGKLHSDSETPIAVIVDGTGSMQEWPPAIMRQLEKLHSELESYAPDFEMSIAVVGDAHSDRNPIQPLQVCDFTKGKELTDFLEFFDTREGQRTIGGGGGQSMETYELAFLLYTPQYCSIPNAKTPMLFVVGDEGYYPTLEPRHIRELIGKKTPKSLDTLDVITDAKQHFQDNVYMFRKQYSRWREKEIQREWEEALGKDRVKVVDHPKLLKNALFEPITGYIARARGMTQEYLGNLSQRADPSEVEAVKDLLEIKIEILPQNTNLLAYVDSLTKGGDKK